MRPALLLDLLLAATRIFKPCLDGTTLYHQLILLRKAESLTKHPGLPQPRRNTGLPLPPNSRLNRRLRSNLQHLPRAQRR